MRNSYIDFYCEESFKVLKSVVTDGGYRFNGMTTETVNGKKRLEYAYVHPTDHVIILVDKTQD